MTIRMVMAMTATCALVACDGGVGDNSAADTVTGRVGSASDAGSVSSAPRVAERYQRGIDRAWARADEGESPGMACAQLVGLAVGMVQSAGASNEEALGAVSACYVDVTVHYVRQVLATNENQNAACMQLIRTVSTMRGSVGSFFDDLNADRADYDAMLVDQVGGAVDAACGEMATVIFAAR